MLVPSCCRAVLCAMVVAVFCGGPARAANWLELNFWLEGPHYGDVLPACNASETLAVISSRFSQKEQEFWNSSLAIVGYDRVRQVALNPWGGDLIPRRFCSARVTLSNGQRRPVYYFIAEAYGMLGAGWGVEWCVVGYDRNWAYNPGCKMARP
jgi:hypothetical protein